MVSKLDRLGRSMKHSPRCIAQGRLREGISLPECVPISHRLANGVLLVGVLSRLLDASSWNNCRPPTKRAG